MAGPPPCFPPAGSGHPIGMSPDSSPSDTDASPTGAEPRTHARRRTAAREAERASRRVAIEWIVVPAVIALVFVIGFGLELLLG
jgi:hypothetical protein